MFFASLASLILLLNTSYSVPIVVACMAASYGH